MERSRPWLEWESRFTKVGRGFDRKILPRRIHSQIISCRNEGNNQTVDYERQLLSSSLTTLRWLSEDLIEFSLLFWTRSRFLKQSNVKNHVIDWLAHVSLKEKSSITQSLKHWLNKRISIRVGWGCGNGSLLYIHFLPSDNSIEIKKGKVEQMW